MRGADTFTESFFLMKRLDDFVPTGHPLRPILETVNKALVANKYIEFVIAARLDWPAITAKDEVNLERRLLPHPRPSDIYAPADFGRIHQDLRRIGMTLSMLCEEYCA